MKLIKFAIIVTTFLLISTPINIYTYGETIQNTINSISVNEIEYYAIISGCQKYKNSSHNRIELTDYSKMLYDELLSCKNWDASNIILLLNENATKDNITNALLKMSELVEPEDVFLFSWAGHGSIMMDEDGDEKEFDPDDKYDEVICPYDYNEYDQVNQTYNKGLNDDELNYYFSKINCKGMLLIFESCFSGGLVSKESFKDKLLKIFKMDSKKINTSDVDGENRIVLMSTDNNKIGYGSRYHPIIVSLIYSLALSINFIRNFAPEEKENLSYFNIYKDGFISAEELFNPTKSIYNVQSKLLFFYLFYYTILNIKSQYKSLISTLIGLLILPLLPLLIMLLTDRMLKDPDLKLMKNNANLRDDYTGELPIIEI